MKNILIVVAVAFVSIIVGSCKKTSQQYIGYTGGNPAGTGSTQQATVIAGSWQTARWQLFQPEEGNSLLRGKIYIDEDLTNHDNDIQFVYVRFRGREEYSFHAVPMLLQTNRGDCDMKFDIVRKSLSIAITPSSNSSVPEIDEVSDLEFRYIFVPADIFTTMMIDWRDYNIVAQALNI